MATGNLEGGPFFPACWFNDEREIMPSYMVSVRLCSCFQGLNTLKCLRVCVQKVLQVQQGPQGWAAPLTNSLLCLSDQTAGSSLPCLSPHQYKLQGQLFPGTLLSSSISSTPSSIHLTGLIIEPSGGEEFQMKTDTYILCPCRWRPLLISIFAIIRTRLVLLSGCLHVPTPHPPHYSC